MTSKNIRKTTASHFDKEWWAREDVIERHLHLVKDLLKMLDGERVDLSTPPAIINRAFLTCDFVTREISKGSRVLDMACGLGFVTHTLVEKGYSVSAFDISEEAISTAKKSAITLKQDPENFVVADEEYLSQLEDSSFDVTIGLGYLRYLDHASQDFVYKNVKRILKPTGTLIIDHQNDLYEMFALNNESIIFWADFMSRYCDINRLFGENELLTILNEKIKTPIRKRGTRSYSKKMEVFSENPLTYADKAQSFGLSVIDILYPFSDIIPPFLQKEVDAKNLESIQRENCLGLSKNWKSMFMCYQFLTFLEQDGEQDKQARTSS